jgi:trehalose 6-phosphate synthase
LVRYGIAALALVVAAAAIAAISPFASTLIERWSRQDIELRSALVFNSVQDELAELLSSRSREQIVALFDRLTTDDRLFGVGFCDREVSFTRAEASRRR